MKKICRITLILMLLAMAVFTMSFTVFAESVYFNGTVGENEKFWIHKDYDTTVVDCAIVNGDVPGMYLSLPNPASVCLEGTPTKAGTFVAYVSVTTSAGEDLEYTVTVAFDEAKAPTEEPKPSGGTPKVTKHPTGETVVEGESAVFIARADNVSQYIWEIGMGDESMTCEEYHKHNDKGAEISGYHSEKLVIYNVPMELDGVHVWCRFVGADSSEYSDTAQIKVIAQKDATPVVTKDPTDETVEEGGKAVFVAKAKYAQHYMWQLVGPDGVIYDCSTVNKSFPDLKVSGATTERVTLSNIPLELNGYKIQCMFTAGDAIASKRANLFVTAKPTEPPTEEPTDAPTEATIGRTEPPETRPVTEEPEHNNFTNPTVTQPSEHDTGSSTGSGSTLLIVGIVCAAAVAISAITAGTILILKKQKS